MIQWLKNLLEKLFGKVDSPTQFHRSEFERLTAEVASLRSEIIAVKRNADEEAKAVFETRLLNQLLPVIDPLSHVISIGDRSGSQKFEPAVVLQAIARLRVGLEESALRPIEIAGTIIEFDESRHRSTKGNPIDGEKVKVTSIGFDLLGNRVRKANVVGE